MLQHRSPYNIIYIVVRSESTVIDIKLQYEIVLMISFGKVLHFNFLCDVRIGTTF